MKLSPRAIPYRTLQRAGSIIVLAFFVGAGIGQQTVGPALILITVILALLAITAYEITYYNRFDYHLTESTLDIHSGVFNKREREIPYRRIQNVDITRNIVQRLLGIAAINLETAGGEATEGSIRYVSVGEANRLQEEIQRRKHQETTPDDTRAPTPESLYQISDSELTLAGAFSFDPRIVGAIGLLASGSIPIASSYFPNPAAILFTITGLIILIAIAIASWLLGVLITIINYYGFILSKAHDELRYERGLFQRYNGSIPLTKIQTITIEDNPLKRIFDYATLTVETAGYTTGQDRTDGSQAAVPIARRNRVWSLAENIEPIDNDRISFTRPPSRIRRRYIVRYLIVLTPIIILAFFMNDRTTIDLPWYWLLTGILIIPPAAHYKWKHRGYWVGPDHIVTRNGYWNRATKIIPYYRIQTIIDTRTIFQRRWNVATIVIDTASSQSIIGHGAAAIDIDKEDATTLRTRLPNELQTALANKHQPTPQTTRTDTEQ